MNAIDTHKVELLAAQDQARNLEEGLAKGVLRLSAAIRWDRVAGLLVRRRVSVVVTAPVRGVTPDVYSTLAEVAYVTTSVDDGWGRDPKVFTTWIPVEAARDVWRCAIREGFTRDTAAEKQLAEFYRDVRTYGYCRR